MTSPDGYETSEGADDVIEGSHCSVYPTSQLILTTSPTDVSLDFGKMCGITSEGQLITAQ